MEVRVGPLDDIAEGGVKIVQAGSLFLGVYRIDGNVYALEDRCSHDDGPLCEGEREGLRSSAPVTAPASTSARAPCCRCRPPRTSRHSRSRCATARCMSSYERLGRLTNALAAVKITTLPGAGSLTDNGVAVTAGQFVTVADINAGKLVFTPAANANGAGYASFTFQVQDDGGTANGGVDLDQSANTITINVTSVNDAPAGTDKTVTTLRGHGVHVRRGRLRLHRSERQPGEQRWRR